VKVLPIPGGNETISNVRIKPGGDLFREASEMGAKGLAYIRVREDGGIDTISAITQLSAIKAELLARSAKPGNSAAVCRSCRSSEQTLTAYGVVAQEQGC